jgi:hypothetical protein
VQQPGEHLQRGGLARAVRPEESDDLTGRDVERDAVDRAHLAVPAGEQTAQGGPQARLTLRNLEDALQLGDANGGLSH